jgi:hypothetical protein
MPIPSLPIDSPKLLPFKDLFLSARFWLLSGLVTAYGAICQLPAFAQAPMQEAPLTPMSAAVVINASPEVVWSAVMRFRVQEPSQRKVISAGDSFAVVEEKFMSLPLIGDASCIYVAKDEPYKRIAYRLLKSDQFTAFKGEWNLSKDASGLTKLSISSLIDTKTKTPVARQLINQLSLQDMQRRLQIIKAMAENQQSM